MEPTERSSLLQADETAVMGQAPRGAHFFGKEPPHAPTDEEKANPISRLLYSWIGKMIGKAEKGDLERGLTMPISRADKTWTLATALYDFLQIQKEHARAWDAYIDDTGSKVRLKQEQRSRGVIRWIGKLQQSPEPTNLVVAVEWSELPKRHRAAAKAFDRGGHVDGATFTDGFMDGERLFELSSSNAYATIEDPNDLQFVKKQGKPSPPKSPSLLLALAQTVKWCLLLSIVPRLTYEASYLAGPVVLQSYVQYLNSGINGTATGSGVGSANITAAPGSPSTQQEAWWYGLILAGVFFCINLGQSLSFQKHFHLCMRAGLNMRSALMAQIVHKAITVSKKETTHPELSAGRIINLMSSDVEHINVAAGFYNYLWSCPIQIVVCVALLYRLIGWIAFASVGFTLVVFPIQAMVMKKQVGARTDLSAATDRRVKATNELFTSIYIVKCMGWESSFRKNVLELREKELHHLRRIQVYRVISSFFTSASPMIVMAAVFILYHVTGHTLTPEVVFPVIALLQILQLPFMVLPMVFNFGIMALVAIRRLNSFLAAEDAESQIRALYSTSENGGNTKQIQEKASASFAGSLDIIFDSASVSAYVPKELPLRKERGTASCCFWCRKKKDPNTKFHCVEEKELLSNISLQIPKGKLTVIVGPTGAGKTTFLETLLGEFKVSKGTVFANKSIAYVPQQAWVMNATVKENILFFDDFSERKFREAIEACQLEVDLTQFGDGEDTEIGERGVSLSGGQKARINLARAVYAKRDVYLMDDPLSAVDAHVSKRLVEDCIVCTLGDKTRVLVTHQTHVIPKADLVIALEKGSVAFMGTPSEFKDWERKKAKEAGEEDLEPDAESEDDAMIDEQGARCRRRKKAAAEIEDEETVPNEATEVPVKKKEGGMSVEEKAEGTVSTTIYRKYLEACGGGVRFFLLLLWFSITECVNVSNTLWLSFWSTNFFNFENENIYLYVYLGIISAAAFNAASRAYIVYGFGRTASKAIHQKLLSSVSAARMSFFDTTPLGRVLNRFAKDLDSVDNELPMNYLSMMQTGFSICSSSCVMIASQPFVLIALLPAAVVYYKIMVFFNSANREVKRVDNINKSPVFAILSEALDGAKSITAFNKAHSVVAEALRRIDACYSSSYLQQIANRWLGTRLELMGNCIITTIALAGVYTHTKQVGVTNVGIVSLGLTLSMSITQQMNWLVRGTAAVEAGMNSIERLVHYSENLPTEDFSWYDAKKGKLNPLPSIPTSKHLPRFSHTSPKPGRSEPTSPKDLDIEFKNVHLRYRDGLPLVLKGASFKIKAKTKVGIVGRSGSGKSTTLQAFLRIVDIADGDILIGGAPIKSLALDHLRSLFALIPQDPVLFQGTVKTNLDPFDEHSDAEIVDAIQKVGLLERVRQEGDPVHCPITEGGKNFSVGQRQLMCMARALLKADTGFILMDEATANIDPQSDQLIQQTIRTAFADFGVITIAHRLETVIDSTQIIVMDAGATAEVGTPLELLKKEGGILRGMVDALGQEQQSRLHAIAEGRRHVGRSTSPQPAS